MFFREVDEPSEHFPDRIEIELHTDPGNLARSTGFSVPLYRDGASVWRQGNDASGDVDVAVIEIDRDVLPRGIALKPFTSAHLLQPDEQVEIGTGLLILGFPLGFHDTLHHMPVARHAVVASSFGLRFQGQGYFLTDARTHRGTSGAPVVMRANALGCEGRDEMPWVLLGIHSARLDVGTRDIDQDEALGLNCAWYADILTILSE